MFDLNYPISADTHFMLKYQNNFQYKENIISLFRLGGNSSA